MFTAAAVRAVGGWVEIAPGLPAPPPVERAVSPASSRRPRRSVGVARACAPQPLCGWNPPRTTAAAARRCATVFLTGDPCPDRRRPPRPRPEPARGTPRTWSAKRSAAGLIPTRVAAAPHTGGKEEEPHEERELRLRRPHPPPPHLPSPGLRFPRLRFRRSLPAAPSVPAAPVPHRLPCGLWSAPSSCSLCVSLCRRRGAPGRLQRVSECSEAGPIGVSRPSRPDILVQAVLAPAWRPAFAVDSPLRDSRLPGRFGRTRSSRCRGVLSRKQPLLVCVFRN